MEKSISIKNFKKPPDWNDKSKLLEKCKKDFNYYMSLVLSDDKDTLKILENLLRRLGAGAFPPSDPSLHVIESGERRDRPERSLWFRSSERDLSELVKRMSNLYPHRSENLEKVKELINKGEEKAAFSLFFSSFPSCLPHRRYDF